MTLQTDTFSKRFKTMIKLCQNRSDLIFPSMPKFAFAVKTLAVKTFAWGTFALSLNATSVYSQTTPSSTPNVSSYNLPETSQTPSRLKIDLTNPNTTQARIVPTADVTPITGRRINSINERIELLKRLVENERIAAQKLADKARAISAAEAEAKSAPLPPVNTAPLPAPAMTPDPRPTEPAEAPEEQFQPSLPMESIESPATSGTQILGGPIDSFELGNSLFLTGNYTAAIKSYQDELKKDITASDKDWLRCLIGICYRSQANLEDAEKTFREVTRKKQGNPFAEDYAKWSLSYVEKRRIANVDFQTIEQEINSILSEKTK